MQTPLSTSIIALKYTEGEDYSGVLPIPWALPRIFRRSAHTVGSVEGFPHEHLRHRLFHRSYPPHNIPGHLTILSCSIHSLPIGTTSNAPPERKIPQYYVTGNHEPIIAPRIWDQVQYELATRHGNISSAKVGLFSTRLKCARCGAWYGRKTWAANTKYKYTVW